MHAHDAALPVIHKLVWALRGRIAEQWPTPGKRDALRFAVTEVAETLDARLRQETRWQRNHERQSTVEEELADTVIMLATALGPQFDRPVIDRAQVALHVLRSEPDLDALAALVAHPLAVASPAGAAEGEYFDVRVAVAYVAAVRLLADPVKHVIARLERIEQKWGTPVPRPEVKVVPPGVNGAQEVVPVAIETFANMARRQAQKGAAKYGASLTDRTEFPVGQYVWEELADLGVYLTRFGMDHDRLAADLKRTQAQLAETEKSRDIWRARFEQLYLTRGVAHNGTAHEVRLGFSGGEAIKRKE